MNVLEPNLQSLVAPISREDFLRDYWTRKPLFVKGYADRLRGLVEELGSLQLTALLAQSQRLQIWNETHLEGPVLPVSLDRALDAYYNRGATLYFHLCPQAPARRWIAELEKDLGQPDLGAHFSLFAVRAGHGTDLHYDRNENFTIQLRGTKCWQVRENWFLQSPDSNWHVGGSAPAYCDPLQVPTEEVLPDATQYVLEPGSMLYVPRGYLHLVTAAEEDSLSCNLMFPTLLWGEALLYILRSRLLAHAALRKSVVGAFGSAWNLSECIPELEESSALLRKCVDEVDAKTLTRLMSDPSVGDDLRRGLDAFFGG